MSYPDPQPLVLLIEDDFLIGMDLSDALEQAGYRVLGPLATAVETLSLMERETPTLAIVDVMLKDGPCTALARELRKQGVPFIVHSACRPDEPLASEFQGVPWLGKPAMPRDVVAVLGELTRAIPALEPAVLSAEPVTFGRLSDAFAGSRHPLIRKLEGFTALSDEDRTALERITAAPTIVAPGTDLARAGDRPDGVILILEGMACRHKQRVGGARQISAYLVPGDTGDLDVTLLDTMDHTITTLSACKVVRLAPEILADLLHNRPNITRALRISTLVDEATLREWLMNVGRRSAVERVAHLMCELLARLHAVGHGRKSSYALAPTQSDLADTTGLSTVHVNRALQTLRQRGLIELVGNHLRILDDPGLRALAEFEPGYLHLGSQVAT
ncbi:response regulator [Methylobacterium terricola]|uniref:Response regulator n=1 Tax=Methylobacterium terricola TaxID=2583531 RepID=A0A5C4L7J1_9HYPH|nr:helix-turn-helix domain-containing protein [Methylobacterium terricola]TNC05296.1 response regulator [Methylobacterium terricola]